ncbi:MAG: hypothetical protein K0R49_276 [Burkholderiales bacterium]|jgi:hypothetical protein|nr:hypothetical protein [Burkholderiales bacterium]MCE3268024.1 hypothetical protein [Burkholderiales bacterium]
MANNNSAAKKSPAKSRSPAKLKQNAIENSREIVSIHQLSKIAMTFWLGGSWMTIAVIFPILFKALDQITASNIAGQILNLNAYIGIICLIMAMIEVIVNHKLSILKTKRFWYIISIACILVINYFTIFPVIYNLRQRLSGIAHQIISIQTNVFDFWHSLSALAFAATCILGVLYLVDM